MILAALALALSQTAMPATAAPKHPAKPVPRGSASPRPSLLEATPNSSEKIVISPKSSTPAPRPKHEFFLDRRGTSLVLGFRANDPDYSLKAGAALVVQVIAAPPAAVEPGLITEEEWPKAAVTMNLQLKGVPSKGSVAVAGKASYTVCNKKTGACERGFSNFGLKP